MGYTTEFQGSFKLDRPLDPHHLAYLKKFSGSRRMRRDEVITREVADPLREAVGLPVGFEGCYCVSDDYDTGVIDSNKPPKQPGLYCQWEPSDDGSSIAWDQGEKFYAHHCWLVYYIEHFIKPWGYKLNGIVTYQGEDEEDCGRYVIIDNVVTTECEFGCCSK